MTVNTPTHGKILKLVNRFHCIYRAMTSITTHTLLNVGRVIELNMIRQHMNSNPFHGFVFFIGLTHFSDPGRVCFHLNMTIHTSAQRWNIGMLGTLHLIMTILAFDLILTVLGAGMEGVIKGNWLFRLIVFVVPDTRLEFATRPKQ